MCSNRPVRLRPARPDDERLLFRIYASTREAELAQTGWDQAQIAAFLEQQHQAQHRHYTTHYADAEFLIIELDGEPAGRLYLARGEEEFRLIDIALFPEYRNRGIGHGLLEELLDEARVAGKPVRLHVEPFNPALRLYQRLGFVQVGERAAHLFMEWTTAER